MIEVNQTTPSMAVWLHSDNWKVTNLGLIKYNKVNAKAKKKQSPPTVRYAKPRKSFFPPSQVAVESTNFFLPPKL